MKKNLTLFFAATLLLLLWGCRAENESVTANAEKEKIAFFENYELRKKISYTSRNLNYANTENPAIPFAQCIQVYLEHHPEAYEKMAGNNAQVYLKVSSQ